LGEDKTIVVVAQREARVDSPQQSDLYTVGTSAIVHKVVKMPNQSLFVFAEGLERVRLGEFTQLAPFMRAHVSPIPEAVPPDSSEIEALQRNVLTLFQQIVAGSPTLSDELSTVAMNIDEPGRLVDFIASSLPSLSTPDKQDTLETLDIRVRAATESAALLAIRFANHPFVSGVLYPGLPSHPGHAIAVKQMSGYGGMLSVRVKGGEQAAISTAARVELWKRATSLGGVESLIEHRASIEGPSSPCPTDLLRLSAGLEDVDDLYNDLDRALRAANA